MHDVAIIGGGPAGSHLAYKLAGAGRHILVIEKRAKLCGPVCCTGIISQDCTDAFAIDNELVLQRVNSARLFSPAGEVIEVRRQQTQACVVQRSALDVLIARRAQSRGVEYVFNSKANDIKVNHDRVGIETETEGNKYSFEARVVIIAAGFSSRLAERAGLGRIPDFTLGAQVEVKTSCNEVEVYSGKEIAPGFFAWLVPTSPWMALVGLLTRRSPSLYLDKLLASLTAQGKITSVEGKPLYRVVSIKPLRRTYAERLLVVGDAAGQVKPTTGGGIYFGLLCADIAADVLNQALETDDLSSKSLSRYEREWKAKLSRELRLGYYARRLFERLGDRQIDRAFKIIKSKGLNESLLEADGLSFDWHSTTLLRLLQQKTLSKVFGFIKPFSLNRVNTK